VNHSLVRLRNGTSLPSCSSRTRYLIALLLFVFPAIVFILSSQSSVRAQGAGWTSVVAAPPGPVDMPILLTDGTVICQDQRLDSNKRKWYRLTPDSTGSYVHGTWSTIALLPGTYSPLYYASAVLKDGRVVIVGGEYNNGTNTPTGLGAIYDPFADSWTAITGPASWGAVSDAQCCVLPDGRFMLANILSGDTAIADFSVTPLVWNLNGNAGKRDRNDEEGWTLLPSGKILTVDILFSILNGGLFSSELYDSSANLWSPAGSPGTQLYDNSSEEIGPGVLRPDGTVFYVGAIGNNAVYNTATGLWSVAPSFPGGLDAADGPACLLPNGHVLCIVSPGVFNVGAHVYEWDGTSLTEVGNVAGAGNISSYFTRLLPLPNGQILFTSSSSLVQIYTLGNSPNNAWRPTIATAPLNLVAGTSNYPITGTQFNGLSQASAYGDDASNATNYPLVRITNLSNGRVTYCRTHGHSTMGVATGGAPVSTQFDVPAKDSSGALMPAGQYNLEVVANGIPSAARLLTVGAVAPTANSQSVNVSHNTAKAITLTGSDPNTPTQPLTFSIGASPVHGALSGFNTATGAVTYTPNAGYNGADSFTFTVTNTSGLTSNTATVSLTVAPAVPVANGQTVSTPQDTAVAVTLTGNDGDDNPVRSLTYIVTANPAHGALTGTAPNLTYTPNAGYFGADSFQFKVNNGILDSNVATVSINVIGKPSANSQVVTIAHNTATAVTLTGSDPNSPPQSLTFTVAANPAHGTLTGTAPNLTYTPTAGYNGPDSFTFTVKNTSGLTSNTATVTLNVDAAVPVANGQMVNTTQDTAIGVTLTGNDGDDNPPRSLTFIVTAAPAHGMLSGTAPNLTYTPNAGYTGPDSFQFKVNNGVFDSAIATVSINVNPTVVNVSGIVTVTRSGFLIQRSTGQYYQIITLTNTGMATINGPISLILDNLTNGTCANASGATSALLPAGRPYINAPVASLAPGASTSFQVFFNKTGPTITYSTEVWAGTGSR